MNDLTKREDRLSLYALTNSLYSYRETKQTRTTKMETTTPSKKYRLQSEPSHFYAGYLKDGTQVLMRVDYPKLVAVLFDTEGTYLKTLVRVISQEAQTAIRAEIIKQRGNPSMSSLNWAVLNRDWEELDQWAEELGFVKGVISIKKFSLPEYELGIQDLPRIFQELIDSGDLPEDVEEDIRNWKEVNDYVFVWGQEYDINQEGEVVST